MGCVLCKRVTGDDTLWKSLKAPFSRRSSRRNINGVDVENNESKERNKKQDKGVMTVTEKYKPRPEFSLKTCHGWPSWLCTFAGDAIKDLTPRRANTFEKLDKVIFIYLLIYLFVYLFMHVSK